MYCRIPNTKKYKQMKIELNQYNKHQIFKATSESGYSLLVGRAEGNNINAIKPMELLLVSLASCSSIDIISILNKQRQIDFSYQVKVDSKRKTDEVPAIFEEITLRYIFKGDVSPKKAKRAVDLSLEKYCSVSKIIEETVKIKYQVIVNGENYE